MVPIIGAPPGNPLTSHCTACWPELFTTAVKVCVVVVPTVMTGGVMVTEISPSGLKPLIGAEVAPPQPAITAIIVKQTTREMTRHGFLGIRGLRLRCGV